MVEVATPVRWAAADRGGRLRLLPGRLAGVPDRAGDVRRRLHHPDRHAQRPDVQNALRLTAEVAFWAVLINLVFGVTISILLVRYEFPGKRLLSALIDVPLSVSPVVVGLALLLVYNGRTGWFGPTLEENGLPGHLQHPRHDHGHLLRGAAPGHPRGRPGARGDRRRPGAGGAQPRGQRAARPSCGSPCPASSGPWSTASCCRSPGPWASSARSRSCPATSPARPRPRLSWSSRSTRTSSSRPAYATSFILAFVSVAALHRRRLPLLARPEGESTDMSIDISGVTKRFGDFVALDDVSVTIPTGQLTALLGPSRRRQVHPAADHRRPRQGRRGHRSPSRASTPPSCRRRSATSASCSSTTPCSST